MRRSILVWTAGLCAAAAVGMSTFGDAAALPIGLARFPTETINTISGFVVFEDVAKPEP